MGQLFENPRLSSTSIKSSPDPVWFAAAYSAALRPFRGCPPWAAAENPSIPIFTAGGRLPADKPLCAQAAANTMPTTNNNLNILIQCIRATCPVYCPGLQAPYGCAPNKALYGTPFPFLRLKLYLYYTINRITTALITPR